MLIRKFSAVTIAVTIAIAGCGGSSDQVWPDVSTAVSKTPAVMQQEKKQRLAVPTTSTTAAPTVDQLLTWAEINFSEFFPEHAETKMWEEWKYRAYSNGALLGVRDGEVYVMNGPFGPALQHVGKVIDYVSAPRKLWPTSYENRVKSGVDLPQIPDAGRMGYTRQVDPVTGDGWGHFEGKSFAYADFMQDGEVVFVVGQHGVHLKDGVYTYRNSRLLFYKRTSDNKYIDVTRKLIKNPADNTLCRGVADLLVADFNGDKKPDIFVGCTGGDLTADEVSGLTNQQISELSNPEQQLFLSQPDGRLQAKKLPFRYYGHGSAAGDINKDGAVDIVLTNPVPIWSFHNQDTMYIVSLINDGLGNFSLDQKRFNVKYPQQFWNLELLDLGRGVLDIVAGSHEYYNNMIIENDGNGVFVRQKPLPTATSKRNGKPFDLLYGVVYLNGHLYANRVGHNYTATGVHRIDLSTMTGEMLWERLDDHSNVITQLSVTRDNVVVPAQACPVTFGEAGYETSTCGLRLR